MAKTNDMGIFKHVPLPSEQSKRAIVYRCLCLHPEALLDDTILKYYILVDAGMPANLVRVDIMSFAARSLLEQLGFYNDETIQRARREVLAYFGCFFPNYDADKSQRSQTVKDFEKEGCMENVPAFFFKPMKANVSYPDYVVEDIMKALGYLNRY